MVNCDKALDIMYEQDDDISFRERLYLAFHILFCGRCALAMRRLETVRELMATDFFPRLPAGFEDPVMEKIYEEEYRELPEEIAPDVPGGIPTRGWVIAGLVAVLSLATLFFGGDFISLVSSNGSSFLLPLGIMTGIFISVYGSLFIGSHLKEFSQWFRLR